MSGGCRSQEIPTAHQKSVAARAGAHYYAGEARRDDDFTAPVVGSGSSTRKLVGATRSEYGYLDIVRAELVSA